MVPALLTRISSRPHCATVCLIIASTSEFLLTSATTAIALSPISPATIFAASSLISATTSFAPSSAKRAAIPRPNPEPAPVTSAILLFRRIFILRDEWQLFWLQKNRKVLQSLFRGRVHLV